MLRLLTFIIGTVSLNSYCAPTLKIQGSTTVNPVISEGAETFRQKGWKILVDTQGGSSGGITALAENQVHLAMSSKPIGESERKKFPNVNFVSHPIGYDGVALVVSQKVFEGGITSLSKDQIKQLYEGKIKSWSDLGGPKLPVVFFNKEPGRGTWEVFASYLYGKTEFAPAVTHPEVGSNEEARTKVAGHPSGITQLSAAWAEGCEGIRAIGLKLDDGKSIIPTRENIFSGKYPITRSLLLVSAGKPDPVLSSFINFFKTEEGQKLVVKHGYLPLQNTSFSTRIP